MGSFYSLQIAKSGLFASQKALEIVGNNIANANTEGYSRQRLDASPAPSYNVSQHAVGSGVNIDSITRIRSKYLDAQFRNDNSLNNELSLKSECLQFIEGIMAEPSDYGLNATIENLFNSLEDLSYDAQNINLREIVVQNAVNLTDTFKSVSGNLIDYQYETDNNISLMVDEVNSLAERIRDINKTILSYEQTGQQANELRDKRDVLVDTLSSIIPVTVMETSDGGYQVKTGGISLVDSIRVNKIELKASSAENQFTGNPINEVYWEGTDTKVAISSGKLKGLLDIRDGATTENQGIPYYLNKLNSLAQEIVQGFNDINQAGYSLPYDGGVSQTGINFFEPVDTDKAAFMMQVSDELKASGYNIAASSVPVVEDLNMGNNENLVKFNDYRNSAGVEEQLQSTISDLAITTSYYINRSENQQTLTSFTENQKLGVSGVSVDEELTYLLQYQQSYNAAAKVIATIDEMLSTIINL